ncbi:DEAD/DEAH box helicase [Fodinibius sp. SL11]|uniref:DEAD/DEAH box helicase n=1 Tax=Fodinibius sp. SL11 TaxID=3425690 RepID=UPI003F8807E9
MSNSEQASEAFELLDRKIQKWIWKEQWDQLRDIQEDAIPTIIEGENDVIIASATASGKTEAAILPILSNAISNNENGVYGLYIGPLKALINDQYRRFSEIAKEAHIQITPWHGDISRSKKKKLLKEPSGVLLITPESLESLFVNHGTELKKIFGDLNYVIIDELHSFIGNERGRHLKSLLSRLELTLDKSITRIGLSATIGDESLAKKFLREASPETISYIESKSLGTDLRLQLRGYLDQPPNLDNDSDDLQEEDSGYADYEISKHLFKTLRGQDNLVFANSRMNVEKYADKLRQFSEDEKVPNEFWPHHGSLSKNLRETIEGELKKTNRPSTAVCTSTLEMGIDIGTVESIAQIGAPPSVASMRQRLGRSGRRGNPAIMRLYIKEQEITDRTPPQDQLRTELVQSIAMVELLINKWIEPPSLSRVHLSTLIHQLLSLIAQYGGVRANEAWTILFEKGPFDGITKSQFTLLLRKLGEEDLITQANDKTLTLGLKGEHIVGHYSFYAAFNTPEEYKIIANGKSLGTIPIVFPLVEGTYIIFAGKRWVIKSVDEDKKVVFLDQSSGGKPPSFGGSGIMIEDEIREKMFEIYTFGLQPPYLNKQGKELLKEGRKYFDVFNLLETSFLEFGNDTLMFVWKGSVIQNTLMLLLKNAGLNVAIENTAILARDCSEENLKSALEHILKSDKPDPIKLVENVKNKEKEKFDHLLPNELLSLEYQKRFISLENTFNYLSTSLV